MKRYKSGFTLSEILVCMVVIGMIMALSVQTLKIVRASYTSLTYFAFKNLQIMVRELYAGQTAKVTTSAVTLCTRSDGKKVYVLKPDQMPEDTSGNVQCSNLPANVSGTNEVCNTLVKMSNTSGRTGCNGLFTAEISDATDEPYISDFNYLNPTFITTNGQRFYLTKRNFDESISSDFGYRLIAIDLNGKSRPNSIEVSVNKLPPDVVTFMIMDNGELYPLGVAGDNFQISSERSIQYINARAKGYYYSDNPDITTGIPEDCYVNKKSGRQQVCNYRIVPIKSIDGKSLYSYREAFCNALGENKSIAYSDYCYGITRNPLCPPSSEAQKFDACEIETIKPMFRYNFN